MPEEPQQPHVAPPNDSRDGLPLIAPDVIEQDFPDEIDNIVPTRGYQMLPIVGLGGSAGCIGALQEFFTKMPADSGMAFVVIVHLSAEHESVLHEVLGRFTSMKVVQAADDQRVEANTVYVIPPGKLLTASNGHLKLTNLQPERGRRMAVDLFFRTLADTHGPHATAVILSGADGDGALGIKRVKERGGLTVAQDPDQAEHPSMPRTAIDGGMVDWILRVEEMPARLLEYRSNARRLVLPSEEGPQPAKAPPAAPDANENALREVLNYLRSRTGRDFSYYKRATVVRRISRRMQVNGTATVPEYLTFLRTHPGEAGALQQDLLISVTNFFRDRDAFEALEAVIPSLFDGKRAGDAVRVWTAACATGEEAYSVAMLLMEQAGKMEEPPAIQVFATDLDEDVIAAARAGLYPFTIAADVSEERLRRFFVKERGGYRARRELRESVLFAIHDLLKDAPFSRIDLITCRNLLIYLTHDAQSRFFQIAHFALRPEGILFLGCSESVDDDSTLFTPLDKKFRIYKRRLALRTGLPVPIGPSTVTRAVEAQERAKGGPFIHGPAFAQRAIAAVQRDVEAQEGAHISWEELHFKLIERFSPPSLIVTRDYDIVHMSENAGRFLHFSGGEPSVNLLKVVHPMLRVELRAALFRAAQSNAPAEVFHVPIEVDGKTMEVDIRAAPAREVAPDYLVVILDVREAGKNPESLRARQKDEPALRHMERELESMKRRLRETIEQYEASTEELKASNEELQAMNEELRSSAEELETSREELQSINEELATVNAELKSKVDELSHANNDLANLMSATGVATLFLDRGLRITRYTPSAVALFRLIQSDLGRPITDLNHKLNYPRLEEDAQQVLQTLIPLKREVTDGDRWFLAQLLPYRTADDHIAGVVLSLVDISESRRAREALKISEERLRLVVESARDYAIFSMDLDRCVTIWNAGAERLLGFKESEIIGQSGDIIFTPEDRAAGAPEAEARQAVAEKRAANERWHVRKNGTRFWASGAMMAMRDATGTVIGFVKIFRDHTAVREAQQKLSEALQQAEQARAEAEAAGHTRDRFMAMLSHELRTPLTPVLGVAETLLRRKDLPPRAVEGLEMICRNIELQTHFINDLLDLTRIARGKLELVRKPMNLHDAVKAAIDISLPDIREKQQELVVELNAKESALIADTARTQQVFWNLLKNASKFTPDRGKIRVVSRNEPGAIIVEVSDNGMGIDPTTLPNIFKAFQQGDTSITRRFGGLGLGLAISKATVEAHGGSIVATSAGPGQGATFTVRFPLEEQRHE